MGLFVELVTDGRLKCAFNNWNRQWKSYTSNGSGYLTRLNRFPALYSIEINTFQSDGRKLYIRIYNYNVYINRKKFRVHLNFILNHLTILDRKKMYDSGIKIINSCKLYMCKERKKWAGQRLLRTQSESDSVIAGGGFNIYVYIIIQHYLCLTI